MEPEQKPSNNSNKNLIKPLLIFVGVSIAAFLIASWVISLF
ncbi:hypothetical protein [Ulvibacter antarcticus]|uniref:Uncharacterized protein n=1 Tax=Ulvibacter antarcticus TaxID=442714 RepID=A0A3L9YEA2_9FLAO|nr:hypothetical protein [Ulvibacter antarcticus]RMA58991.1 hypothetical protein BXY75_2373 [Ulvibacter antarcticus]